MSTHHIALLPGDGIGVDVIREGQLVLDTLAQTTGAMRWDMQEFPWSCDYYLEHGQYMPDDALDILDGFDAILYGACGLPDVVPDEISQHQGVLRVRQGFELYVNLRPARLLPGLPTPLAGKGPGDFDLLCVRENSEGEYAGCGGRVHQGSSYEVALQTTVFTREGVERIIRYAFDLTARLGRRHVTNVTKSNALQFAPVFWDEVFEEVAADYPGISTDRNLVDAAAARMVSSPETFDVLVASNLFGDILSDIGGALMGSLGVPASANINPEGAHPPMFEPVHGSAPDIAGQGIASPIATIWAASMMVEHLGHPEEAELLMAALGDVTASGALTPDLGGDATTTECGAAVRDALRARAASAAE